MRRRSCLRRLGLTAVVLLISSPAALAQQRDSLQVVPVAPGIWMMAGEAGNIALAVGSEGALLVDAGYARTAPRVLAFARSLTDRPIRFLLDTHWHADHAEGNAVVAAAGAIVVAQENTRIRLSTAQRMRGYTFPPLPPPARPALSFTDSIAFHLGGNDAVAFWVGPAHTDGDVVVVWNQANVIHTGDLTCYYAYPFFDEDTGGDVASMVQVVDRLVAMSDGATRIIGGHGPLATRADLVQYRDMLGTITGAIARQIAAGRSVAEVIASKPTAPFDARWARPGTMPADTFVALIYRNLKARGRSGG